ncbi:MAG: NAD kinase [Pseudopedobacter saltans]|uniref:NAD kinase n=1 Tax=Pseudopedobacter saltans TaxID=151895 RepID=A0A2W5H2W3_9SPHI|nr:MAG: NAD kinase [Pseudopedobacter saltans]
MIIAIYSRGLTSEQKTVLDQLVESLQKYHVKILFFNALVEQYPSLKKIKDASIFGGFKDLPVETKVFISLGGDGTILDAVTIVRNKGIPILGINLGRLGFLASINSNEITKAVDALFHDSFIVDHRSLLHIEGTREVFGKVPFGLNDFAILKQDIAPMINIHTYLNGELLNTYWSDGLIVATPTGSTAYNLSCNGPLVFPHTSSFVITPIAPHQLNVRPIVIPDDSIISFEVESRSNTFICSLDARREIVRKEVQIAVRKEDFQVGIIRLEDSSFLTTLRNKFDWGVDKRN